MSQGDTEAEKGRRFLELIDKQSTIQQAMASKLTRLINDCNWDSDALRTDLSDMVREHSDITREINGLENDGDAATTAAAGRPH